MINSTVKDSFTVAKGWRKRGGGRIKPMNTTQTQVRSTDEALSVFDFGVLSMPTPPHHSHHAQDLLPLFEIFAIVHLKCEFLKIFQSKSC